MNPTCDATTPVVRATPKVRVAALGTISALAAFWLSASTSTAGSDRVLAATIETALAEVAWSQPQTSRPESSEADVRRQRDEHRKLRSAIERRDLLVGILGGLELAWKMRDAEAKGEHFLPATIGNCARIVGAGKREDCPLPFESPETLRYLADCDMLNFDIPWQIYGGPEGHPAAWEDLDLSAEQRRALEEIDLRLRDELQALARAAHQAAFGSEPADEITVDAFMLQMMSKDMRDTEWAYGLAAGVRLGEVAAGEIAALPPVPKLYATLAVSGDAYEDAVSAILGEELARDLRRRDSGWGAQGVAGGGECPLDIPREP
jgi:hypothetical protein